MAFRPKDRDFVRVLVVDELVSVDLLLDRVGVLQIDDELRRRILGWVEGTAGGL